MWVLLPRGATLPCGLAASVAGPRGVRHARRATSSEHPASLAIMRRAARAGGSQEGQAAVEWIGLLLLAGLLLGALLASLGSLSASLSVPSAILERLVCAVRLTEDCRNEPALRDAYGPEVAALVRAHAPALLYEDGMRALPVDYRSCRRDACAEGQGEGQVARSAAGLPVTAFTHVIDCRSGSVSRARAAGADCSGERAGALYLQYWLYYPGSATGEGSTPLKSLIRSGSEAIGHPTYHPDDWESIQVRIDPDGRRWARASSHHGYGGGWVRDPDGLYVSGGSHAGQARFEPSTGRTTKDHRIRLVPLGRVIGGGASFAITPPWRKRVFRDPEYRGTD